jgi:CRISPR-associated endonuclease/helicase Cas3
MQIAHKDIKGQVQSLMDHSMNVAEYSKKIGDKVGLGDFSYLLGLLHDIGKADRKFQNKILNGTKENVIHSSAGAKYFLRLANTAAESSFTNIASFIEVGSYVIGAHHGLYDIFIKNKNNDYINLLYEKFFYDENREYHFVEDVLPFSEDLEKKVLDKKNINLENLFKNAYREYDKVLSKLGDENITFEEIAFYRFMIIRLLLSILKTADVRDTINATEKIISNEEYVSGEKILDAIEETYKKFGKPKEEINKVKTKISVAVKERGFINGPGIYKLDIPTGSGKTLASSRYGAAGISTGKFERFIYVTAFLSVLEQNAQELKNVFGKDNVLEHHSNVVEDIVKGDEYDEDSIEFKNREYLMETWNERIVATTMVQFFNSLIKGKSANIRRFASLINSVIILDEVQSLPIETTYIFNMTMNFLAKVMGANIVLCTATQPEFDNENIKYKINYGGLNGESESLYEMTEEDYKVFRRNKVTLLTELEDDGATINDIVDELNKNRDVSRLVIVNTKKVAKKIYECVKDTNEYCYYLSTDFCPEHRRDIIAEIKEKLSENLPVICSSTQLIEAGVDIDFDMLIRSFAGADSIMQSDGRANRSGRLDFGTVKLAYLQNSIEDTRYLKGIDEKKDVSHSLLFGKSTNDEIDLKDLNKRFYRMYFSKYVKKMGYPMNTEGIELFNLMSVGERPKTCIDPMTGAAKSSENVGILASPFETIANEFELIDDNDRRDVIVYYKDNYELIEELIENIKIYEKSYDGDILTRIKKLLKKLQPYTVSIFKKKEIEEKLIKYLDDVIAVLPKEYYSEKTGIDLEKVSNDDFSLVF